MEQFLVDSKSKLEYLNVDNKSDKAVIILHGYGASMYDLYPLHNWIENHDQFDWYFPNGPVSLMPGSLMGRAWFPIDEQALQQAMMTGVQRQFAEINPPEMETSLKMIKEFMTSKLSTYKEIIIGGFSQGTMMTTHLLADGGYNFTHGIFFSGTLISKSKFLNSSHAKKIKFIQSHGKQDPLLEYAQAKDLFEALKLSGHQGEFISFDGAHEIPEVVLDKWKKFMSTIE